MKSYLSSNDIRDYLQLSRTMRKTVVVTDRCGSGKTTARNHYVNENVREAPRLVMEKKASCNRTKEDLITINPELEKLIGVYHSDEATSDNIRDFYDSKKSKPISIITHERLNIDPLQSWLGIDSGIMEYSPSVIIDEMPNNQVSKVNIVIETLLDRTKRLNPKLAEYLEKVLDGSIEPLEVKEILNRLVLVEPYFGDYVGRIIKHKIPFADAGIVTDPATNQSLANLEQRCLSGRQRTGEENLLINRFLYQLFMIYFAILSGRTKEIEKGFLTCSILSPLYAWNAIHGVGVIILDATGQLEMYPKDLCHVAEPKIKPRADTIKVHRIEGNPDKRIWKPNSKEGAEKLSNQFYILAKDILKTTCVEGNVVYLCTWMDKAKSKTKRDYIIEETGTTSISVNSVDINYAHRRPQHKSNIFREYATDPSPRLGRWFKPGEINAESAVREAANDLGIYTNFDMEEDLRAAKESGSLNDPAAYFQLSRELDAKIGLYICHFGMSKGENRYKNCNTVIILGDHYLPRQIYADREIYMKRRITEIDKYRSVAATTIQEIERSGCRLPVLPQPINCYLMTSEEVFNEIKSYYQWQGNCESYRIHFVGERPADEYAELGKLTKGQHDHIVKISMKHPGLFDRKPIQLSTTEAGRILGVRPNNVIRTLLAICNKSRFELEMMESNQVGSSVGNKFVLQLC